MVRVAIKNCSDISLRPAVTSDHIIIEMDLISTYLSLLLSNNYTGLSRVAASTSTKHCQVISNKKQQTCSSPAEMMGTDAVLASMVLMIWLGGVDRELRPAIKDLVPWRLANIKYPGLAGDNPLARSFNGRQRI